MNYRPMRRSDRERSKDFAYEVIDSAPFGTLALAESEHGAYAVPLSFAREGDALYFHCAAEGQKLDCLQNDNRVCASFVSYVRQPQDDFTTAFKSATVYGTAVELTTNEDKIHGLRVICRRYTPAWMSHFEESAEKSLAAVAVWRIDIAHVTGKERN
jgi:nitroimidazol reductase NimA-like FMN-containing flavoprotein (pyridoxamine 5'-phosphate oxidase superfamily)